MASDSLLLLVGLGNPEPEYAGTRHNIGFMAADAVAAHTRCPAWKKKFSGLVTAPVSGNDFLLLKPLTYMNLSGKSSARQCVFIKWKQKTLLFSTMISICNRRKLRSNAGADRADITGSKSLDAHIGPEYLRVRLGIGHPGIKGDAVTNYVLGAFAKADRAWLEPLLDALASGLDLLLKGKTAEYLAHLPHKGLE